ncbi:hypothetical protein [Streptomyces sp. NPDC058084]|uniref:hypothetical protein n=1 Tax=Streptomyces sp. NPDC058084 TaxID=3346333 RepID=UPI0036EF082B
MSTVATEPPSGPDVLAATAGPPPPTIAVTVDHQGRPLCDGTTHRDTRNCTKLADFKLERPGGQGTPDHACEGHVGQVASFLNDGESGARYEHRLTPIRTKE